MVKKNSSRLVYLTDLLEIMADKNAIIRAVKGKILTPSHLDTSDLMKYHRWLLKHDITIFDVSVLCFVRPSRAASGRVESHEWPAGYGM